jgi:hypothetical protein
MAVHLLLGDPQDPCCSRVRSLLEARNYPTRIIANPLMYPSLFGWQLNNDQSASQLSWDEKPPLLDKQISGVLVRNTGWIDPTGWEPDDLTYVQVETQAALLAWLWSLACPVVNRYPSAIWYRTQVPLLAWQRLLRESGLPTLETLITNVEHEARAFGQRLSQEGVAGVVYGQLTSSMRYFVTGEEDWSGLATMQRTAPVCLAYPYGAAQFVCVVGEQVVWEGETPSALAIFEPALRRFATAAGLAFVELAFASISEGFNIIAVEPHPHLERFGETAQQQIVEAIVQLLTVEDDYSTKSTAPTLHRRIL